MDSSPTSSDAVPATGRDLNHLILGLTLTIRGLLIGSPHHWRSVGGTSRAGYGSGATGLTKTSLEEGHKGLLKVDGPLSLFLRHADGGHLAGLGDLKEGRL